MICVALTQGFPGWGYIYLHEGVLLRPATEGQGYLFIIYFQISIHTSVNLFSKIIISLLLNMSMISGDKIFCHKKYACSSIEILKGYVVRERLGTHALKWE